MSIRLAKLTDAAAIAAIYNYYVETSTVTFEEQAVEADDMARRVDEVGARLPWYVYAREGAVVAFAYATPWRSRSAYRFSVESTVYVAPGFARQGIGSQLYQALIDDLRARGMQVVLGGIAQPNTASVRLHESVGFEKVALFKRVGRKFGQWVDVGYWELQLSRAQ
ncbi:arsinothricin resistance N-acetyltransferase ArsN1 family B [Massilia psychrophila]|uniref:Phosphinothricin acetyltransferase n=1 Tax=Massilia psychrophila TaxID=1603353 RepID=A0A2G8T3R1_9BURK|nr:arsinothricin resistance N-acetyltransferase ArsN1 family B [Massilia psychrophila]PIL40318.1 phosphinothricin acetyltransferase [Massilia psychrophila]GGE77602.1 N-acetyltransferase [Massilia psychrophila]